MAFLGIFVCTIEMHGNRCVMYIYIYGRRDTPRFGWTLASSACQKTKRDVPFLMTRVRTSIAACHGPIMNIYGILNQTQEQFSYSTVLAPATNVAHQERTPKLLYIGDKDIYCILNTNILCKPYNDNANIHRVYRIECIETPHKYNQ